MIRRYDNAQALCYYCNVRHLWDRKAGPQVSAAKCPACGFDLHRTTAQVALRLTTVKWASALGAGQPSTLAPGHEAAEARAYYAKAAQ
jgi:hypothetical protein